MARHFSDDHVLKLLKRAVELQSVEQNELAPHEKKGVTLEELKSIAAEAGISSESLLAAISELDSHQLDDVSQQRNRFLGSSAHYKNGITFNFELNDEQMVQLAQQINSLSNANDLFGKQDGIVNQIGKTITWSTDAYLRRQNGIKTFLTIESGNSMTTVSVSEDRIDSALGLFGGLIGGFGIGAGVAIGTAVGLTVLHSPLFAVLAPIVTLTTSYFSARGLFRYFSKVRSKRILETLKKIKELISKMSIEDLSKEQGKIES